MTQLARKTDDEAGALVRLGFEELRGFTESIGTTERDIAARVFRFVPAGKPIQLVHDTIAGSVVGALGGAASAAGRGAHALVGRRPRPERPLSATPRGGLGISVLNGLVGDRLEREGSPLAQPMAVRVDGLPVAPRRAELAEAFPAATPRLVVFLHGLMESERGWHLGGREDYGSRLARDLGVTPVYVRYNSGRHISENGRALAELLEAVVAEWPVAVEEVALVGHSMGGLVSRSACHLAALDGRRLGAPRAQGRLARLAAHGRAARAGGPLRRLRPQPAPGDAHVSARSCAAAARGSGTCGRARWSTTTGASATRRRCAPPPARRCRCSRARRTASSPRPSRAARATRSAA